MNRRGHLSHKIPNVKLRPVPPPSARRSTRRHPSPTVMPSEWDAEDDEGDEEEVPLPMGSSSDRPWRGIVVTFTGVEEKPALSALVKELGGDVESALTIKVTHVVASGYGSPKYLYAVEHRIPVMAPGWIAEAHRQWLKGDELDVPSSVEAYRLQPFLGLKIAVSGIDQLDRRKQIIRHINGAGGLYSKDLDRTCTHLISAFPTRDPKAKLSEKVKWALKEIGDRDAQRRRGRRVDGEDIRIVYEEWIWDCVGYGGRWKEDAYDARKPRAEGKVRYEDVIDGTAFIAPEKAAEEQDEEPVVVKKRKRDNIDSLVGELLSTTKAEPVEADEPNRDTSEEKEAEDAKPKVDALPSRSSVFERKPSVLHATRDSAFATPASAGPSRLPSSRAPPSSDLSVPNTGPSTSRSRGQNNNLFFDGLVFSHAIAEGYQGLESALTQFGGKVVSESDRLAGEQVDYVVIRISSGTLPPMPDPPLGKPATVVTECWVEACCFEERLLSPEDNLVFQPLPIEIPIPRAEELLVHISGFSTETSVYLRRLLKTIGGVLSEKLNRRTTHLVCASPSGLKYDKANEWGVTVVRDSWLWTMGRTGVIEPVEKHLYQGATPAKASSNAANLSNVSELAGSAGPDLTSSSLPASRLLKSTPTHVEAGALSPSTVATERRLNLARGSPASASVPGSSPRAPQELKAATVATVGGNHGKDEVTAALRRLAEGGVPSNKVIRRSRTSSTRRAERETTTGTPTPVSASSSPVKTKESFPPPPARNDNGPEDESMRVTYTDAASEKERKRLLDAVMRNSPAKRARV